MALNTDDRPDRWQALDAGEPLLTRRLQRGLESLWTAARYAENTRRSPWDFAVEIDELRAAGVSRNDLRWLILKELVEHGRERPASGPEPRRFEPGDGWSFEPRSCFVLTERGAEFVRLILLEPLQTVQSGAVDQPSTTPQSPPEVPSAREAYARPPQPTATVPRWDGERRELWLGDVLVKRFRVPAPRQELLLTVFEEEGWPLRIDDPLPPHPAVDPKRQLHAVISALNRNQKTSKLHFSGDGNGTGVLWQAAQQ